MRVLVFMSSLYRDSLVECAGTGEVVLRVDSCVVSVAVVAGEAGGSGWVTWLCSRVDEDELGAVADDAEAVRDGGGDGEEARLVSSAVEGGESVASTSITSRPA